MDKHGDDTKVGAGACGRGAVRESVRLGRGSRCVQGSLVVCVCGGGGSQGSHACQWCKRQFATYALARVVGGACTVRIH